MTSLNKPQQLDEAVHKAIQAIAVGPDRGRDISSEQAEQVMTGILNDLVDPVQAAVFLIALRMKRESLDEFSGLLSALEKTTAISHAEVDTLVCLAEPFDGYVRNTTMTPFIAPVLAACGLPVIMHGVESLGPKYGVTAHKVYQAHGIDTLSDAKTAKNNIERHAWAYLDQSIYNPKLHALQGLRNKIIKRSALTTLERLLCPVRAETTGLALAYVHKAYPSIYAQMAQQVGYQQVLLFKGVEGGLAPALNKPIRRYFCDSADLCASFEKLEKQVLEIDARLQATRAAAPRISATESVAANEVQQTLSLGLSVLNGEASLARKSLTLAAAHIFFSFRPHYSLPSCIEKVERSLDNGSALATFNALTTQ